jgi:hypothetical protein
VMAFVMKLVALLLPAKREIERRAMSWVLFSPNSVLRGQRATGAGPVVLRILMLFAAVLLSYWVYWQLVRGFQIHGILLSYLAVPFLLLIGESLVAILNLFLLPCGCLLPAVHCRPWAARSIADFWGNRWKFRIATPNSAEYASTRSVIQQSLECVIWTCNILAGRLYAV